MGSTTRDRSLVEGVRRKSALPLDNAKVPVWMRMEANIGSAANNAVACPEDDSATTDTGSSDSLDHDETDQKGPFQGHKRRRGTSAGRREERQASTRTKTDLNQTQAADAFRDMPVQETDEVVAAREDAGISQHASNQHDHLRNPNACSISNREESESIAASHKAYHHNEASGLAAHTMRSQLHYGSTRGGMKGIVSAQYTKDEYNSQNAIRAVAETRKDPKVSFNIDKSLAQAVPWYESGIVDDESDTDSSVLDAEPILLYL